MKIVIEGDVTVKSIDRAVRQAWQEFPSLAWQRAVSAVEGIAVRQNNGALRTKGYEKRTLWTSAGHVEFRRRRFFYAEGREEGSFHVFDLRVDLQLFTYRELKRRNPELPPHMNGTGAMERNIGTVVGHRMKHRGMGWTRKGAANIMRVRLEMVAPRTS